jgi:hypothetical protein
LSSTPEQAGIDDQFEWFFDEHRMSSPGPIRARPIETTVSLVMTSTKIAIAACVAVAVVISGVTIIFSDPTETVELSNDYSQRLYLSCEYGNPTPKPAEKARVTVSIFDPQPCFAYDDNSKLKNHVGAYVGCLFFDPFTTRGNSLSAAMRKIDERDCGNLGGTW